MDVIHLCVAGEEHKCPPLCDLEQPPDQIRCFRRELWSTRIRKIGRYVKNCLTGVIEMRRQHRLPRVFESQPPADILESPAHRKRRRSQYRAFEIVEKTFLQDRTDIDRSSLQEDV